MFDFIKAVFHGETASCVTVGVIGACVAFFILYEKVAGRPFVKSKEERREAMKRRKIVLWEYRRQD